MSKFSLIITVQETKAFFSNFPFDEKKILQPKKSPNSTKNFH